jgi:hypothetical protein
VLVAAALAALASVLLALRGLRGEPRRGFRAVLVALRSVAALAALFLVAEPALRVVQTTRVRNRLAVMVDRSRSMNFPVEPGGETRVEAAARFVAGSRPGLEALAAEATVEGWGFARDAWPADLAALARPDPATGGATDALGALRAAAAGSGAPGRRLASRSTWWRWEPTPRATSPSSGWRWTTSPSFGAPSPSRPRCGRAASGGRT